MTTIELNAKITERIDLGPESAIFRILPEGWETPEFKPGQFATLGLPGSAPRLEGSPPDPKEVDPDKLIRRAYSLSSSPLLKDYLEFYIVLVRDGTLTPRLWNLKAGDKLFMGKKMAGQFVMDDIPEDQNILLFMTGTGIAPAMSMLHTFLAPNQKRRFVLFHGCRVSQDLAYRSELAHLSRLLPNFDYVPMISRPHLDPIPWKGPVGHIQKFWEEKAVDKLWDFHPSPENTHIFICGSPKMSDEMIAMLDKEGFKEHTPRAPGQVHVEKY